MGNTKVKPLPCPECGKVHDKPIVYDGEEYIFCDCSWWRWQLTATYAPNVHVAVWNREAQYHRKRDGHKTYPATISMNINGAQWACDDLTVHHFRLRKKYPICSECEQPYSVQVGHSTACLDCIIGVSAMGGVTWMKSCFFEGDKK